MIIVRYPNGQAIQYNTATFLRYTSLAWEIYTKTPENGGFWVASIQLSAGAIVEVVPACRVYDASQKIDNDKITELTKEIKAMKRKVGAKR